MGNWLPKSVLCLKSYTKRMFVADLLAGITVGLVALPLAMAFAIASGVPPQTGLYCAIVAGFAISALGGSSTQIGGPTGAFVVVVFGIVAKHGVDGLFMCTLMAGVILLILGATGLGTAVKFIPRPVVVGFTNGIAVIIASTQIKDFFGLKIDKVPGEFAARILTLAHNFSSFSPPETALAVGGLVVIVLFMLFVKKVPGYIVALFAGTAAVVVFKLPVETIGTRFGGIPSGFPKLMIPHFRVDLLRPLISPAITVAMLGAIESLMSAVVSDRMSGDKHNPNVELVGQGVANILSPLFGGLPATGAIARTATNIRSGAKTPVAGMIHALTLLAIVVFAAPLARFIPLSVLAAILLVVSYNMGEWREIPELFKQSAVRDCRLVGDISADRFCRPDRGCRSGHDSGGVGIHTESYTNHHGVRGNRRVHSRGACSYLAAQGNSCLRQHLQNPWPLPVWRNRQNRCDRKSSARSAAYHYS